jgi:hypothetical protein
MHVLGRGRDAGKSGGSPDHCTLYVGMKRSDGHTAAREEAELHDPDLTARPPNPVEGAWKADVSIGRLFNKNWELRALQLSLDRRASVSEDSDARRRKR